MFDLIKKIIEKRNNSSPAATTPPGFRTRMAAAVVLLEAYDLPDGKKAEIGAIPYPGRGA